MEEERGEGARGPEEQQGYYQSETSVMHSGPERSPVAGPR